MLVTEKNRITTAKKNRRKVQVKKTDNTEKNCLLGGALTLRVVSKLLKDPRRCSDCGTLKGAPDTRCPNCS